MRAYAARYAVDAMIARGPIRTWIVDDTGFVGREHQAHADLAIRRLARASGVLALHPWRLFSLLEIAHVAADFQLYIPESWVSERERCRRAHIPDDVEYAPKWCLALGMIEPAVAQGLPPGVVLADCDYGNKTAFRDALDTMGLQYAVEVQSTTMVSSCIGNTGRLGDHMSVGELGAALRPKLRTVTWRQGTKAVLRSRFARLRVVVDRDDEPLRPPQWLLVEWPEDESAPTKFVLSTMPKSTSCNQLVHTFKERWRIERSYEDLKGELGLDHYEGRSYIGWHHHVSVVLACYAFLVAEHARSFPPSAKRRRHARTVTDAA